MSNLTKIKKFLDRKIRRSEAEVEKYKEYNSKDHTFHGGWSKGYAEGRLSALQDIEDMIDEGLLNG